MDDRKEITAQLSLYALGREEYRREVDAAIEGLAEHGLNPKVGPLSTSISGNRDKVFGAVRELFEQASRRGPAVLTVTFANASPDEILGEKYPH